MPLSMRSLMRKSHNRQAYGKTDETISLPQVNINKKAQTSQAWSRNMTDHQPTKSES